MDVPFVSQSEALCGGAAAAMVLRYWGERGLTAESFATLVDRSAAGIRTSALIGDLARRGWNATAVSGNDDVLRGELTAGRPALALIEDRPHVYHYIVIVGTTTAAVIFHDPARAPFRVMARAEFERRWQAADRWMAVILPVSRADASVPAPAGIAPGREPRTCDERIAAGVAAAQAGDLERAEQTLVAALSCPGAAAPRELAGVRLLQRRWDDVAQLAGTATAIDPLDDYAWRLLGTSRFLLDQPLAALDAWNHVGEPRLDLIRVDGLERTRQRPVEHLLGMPSGTVVSGAALVRAERALRELPSARSTRLELVPVAQGLAELHATVAERPLVPRDVWSYAAIGAMAAANRTARVTLGSVTGGGESVDLEWRFWPRRPRVAASYRAPAPWGGTWGADAFGESQEFDAAAPVSRRNGGRLVVDRWMARSVRVEAHGGADRWRGRGALASLGAAVVGLSWSDHLSTRVAADGWVGASPFASATASLNASTGTVIAGSVPLGPVLTATAGLGLVTRDAPPDMWPGGDTGHARSVLLRAHPLLDDGRLRADRLGRGLQHASVEAQYWWKGPALTRAGAVLFVDYARTAARLVPAAPLGDVDAGGGVRFSSLLVPGQVQIDVARGLRDGATALSVRYVTPSW